MAINYCYINVTKPKKPEKHCKMDICVQKLYFYPLYKELGYYLHK